MSFSTHTDNFFHSFSSTDWNNKCEVRDFLSKGNKFNWNPKPKEEDERKSGHNQDFSSHQRGEEKKILTKSKLSARQRDSRWKLLVSSDWLWLEHWMVALCTLDYSRLIYILFASVSSRVVQSVSPFYLSVLASILLAVRRVVLLRSSIFFYLRFLMESNHPETFGLQPSTEGASVFLLGRSESVELNNRLATAA